MDWKFYILNNTVELIGVYGSDEIHALSAWTSTSRDLTDEKKERIPKLLKMLATEGHHTPFEKSALHFLVTADTASHIHLIKHRIAVPVNTESARYKELKEDKYYIPVDWPLEEQNKYLLFCQKAYLNYHKTLEILIPKLGRKRAKESARFYIPYSNQLTMDVMFNFRSFMHFQSLRNKDAAQLEIKQIAQQMLDLVKNTRAFTHSLGGFGYS